MIREARRRSPDPSPLVRDVGVVGLVPDDWTANWQVRHQVLSRLARYFPVVWVNPAHEWRESATRWRDGRPPATVASPGLTVYTPELWRPRLHRPGWAARRLRASRLARACRLLQAQGCRRMILYLFRPEFAEELTLHPVDWSCYHIDDEFSFSPVDLPTDPQERQLIAAVGRVFIHSPALLEKKGGINPRTSPVWNGVDFWAYATPHRVPEDLRAIPRPRVGYTGTLKRELDWPLLAELADRRPDVAWVFVGPVKPHAEVTAAVAALSARPNVHFLGPKSVGALAAYPQHFDVCIMPYVVNDYTRYIYPLKLHEYLASGRPVVGTRIRSLEPFAHVVDLAEDVSGWSAALAGALTPAASAPTRAAARRAVARAHDWDHLVRGIAGTLAADLGLSLPLPGTARAFPREPLIATRHATP